MPDGHSPGRVLVDLAYARWLVARGETLSFAVETGASEECDRASLRANEAAWEMVRLPAQERYQIKMKLEVYRESFESGEPSDGLNRALLASIERDLSE